MIRKAIAGSELTDIPDTLRRPLPGEANSCTCGRANPRLAAMVSSGLPMQRCGALHDISTSISLSGMFSLLRAESFLCQWQEGHLSVPSRKRK